MIDLVIIGGGAAGLSAAVYASRENLNFVLAEKMTYGGQIIASDRVDNYLGLYGKSGFELCTSFYEHANALGTKFINSDITQISYSDKKFVIEFSDNTVLNAKSVVIATGASPKRLGIDGETELLGKGVSYCATCDGAFYKNKTVAVIGGGDTAVHEALYLSKIAKTVYLIHRRDQFRAAKSLTEKIRNCENLHTILNSSTVKICGENKVERLIYSQNNTENEIAVDGIFIAVGYTPNSKLVGNLCELDKYGYIIADESCKTSFEGLFAAGDVRTKPMRQLITAASDGANCISSVVSYLNNE